MSATPEKPAPVILPPGRLNGWRIILLFAVAGASCGLFVALRAWRAWHPGERVRFSLKTMVILAFLWGVLLLAFQPAGYQAKG